MASEVNATGASAQLAALEVFGRRLGAWSPMPSRFARAKLANFKFLSVEFCSRTRHRLARVQVGLLRQNQTKIISHMRNHARIYLHNISESNTTESIKLYAREIRHKA